jgi:hypothetical protein
MVRLERHVGLVGAVDGVLVDVELEARLAERRG